MKRFFINPKSLKGRNVKYQINGRKVTARMKGQGINWQIMD